MTREDFIKELKEYGYSYEEEGDKIIVTHKGNVRLNSLETIPPDVEFRNEGEVSLDVLMSLPSGVIFKNRGDISLNSLTSLPPGLEFGNSGYYIWMYFLTNLPPGVEFKNGRGVFFYTLFGGWFDDWKGNIEGIEPNRLLNKMISMGLFNRK